MCNFCGQVNFAVTFVSSYSVDGDEEVKQDNNVLNTSSLQFQVFTGRLTLH
jgi:hypothetical protein